MKEVSAREFLKMIAIYLSIIADFMDAVAKVEKEYPDFPSLFSSEAKSFWMEQFPKLVSKLDEKEFLSIMRIIYHISRIPNPWVLSPEEKMDYSSKLKFFSKEVLKMVGEI